MWSQVFIQAKNAFITIAWSAVGSLVVYLIISLIVGLRVSPEAEREGLDISEHGERAYNM
jgi:Amt family ammonium transporter